MPEKNRCDGTSVAIGRYSSAIDLIVNVDCGYRKRVRMERSFA
jgi:hypothetical protein